MLLWGATGVDVPNHHLRLSSSWASSLPSSWRRSAARFAASGSVPFATLRRSRLSIVYLKIQIESSFKYLLKGEKWYDRCTGGMHIKNESYTTRNSKLESLTIDSN